MARAALVSVGHQRAGNDIALDSSIFVDPIGPRSVVGGGGRFRRDCSNRRVVDSEETLDVWMRESVTEIVKNIGKAPFFVHVFSDGDEGPSAVRLEREAADAESWPHIKKRWSTGGVVPPDGVILVEELRTEEGAAGASDGKLASCSGNDHTPSPPSPCSKTWGVLVQGRGAGRAAACYILDTCRVRSSVGFATHFCLAKAKCFGDPADVQLRNAWLLKDLHQQQ